MARRERWRLEVKEGAFMGMKLKLKIDDWRKEIEKWCVSGCDSFSQ
jgi:hypothetical protein